MFASARDQLSAVRAADTSPRSWLIHACVAKLQSMGRLPVISQVDAVAWCRRSILGNCLYLCGPVACCLEALHIPNTECMHIYGIRIYATLDIRCVWPGVRGWAQSHTHTPLQAQCLVPLCHSQSSLVPPAPTGSVARAGWMVCHGCDTRKGTLCFAACNVTAGATDLPAP